MVNLRDIPIYIPSGEQHGDGIPKIFAEALRQQGQDPNEATDLGYRPPTPPPEPDVQAATKPPTPASTPGLKRRPSSSPAAAKARRRRRRRPRPRQPSVISDQESPIPPPRPELSPFYPPRAASPPYSFFGIIRGAKAEKEEARKKRAREEEVSRKKIKKERREVEIDVGGGCNDDARDRPARKPDRLSKTSSSKRASAPLSYDDPGVQENLQDDQPFDEAYACTESQRDHGKHGRPRRRKHQHHRRSGEQHHRRQKRRARHRVRDFFASLRRKLGNLLRLTLPTAPTAPSPPPARVYSYAVDDASMPPAWDLPDNQFPRGEAEQPIYYQQAPYQQPQQQSWGRRQMPMPMPVPIPTPMQTPMQTPYFMHGARSPAPPWHTRLSKPRSSASASAGKHRFSETATVESAPSPSPSRSPRRHLAHHASGSTSTISVLARRFMGPFLSEPSDGGEAATVVETSWRGQPQRKLLMPASASPATPPSSRPASPALGRSRSPSPSPGRGRGRRTPMPGAYGSSPSSSSMGLRSLYPSPSPESRSCSTAALLPAAQREQQEQQQRQEQEDERNTPGFAYRYRVASAEYGLADLFASTTPRASVSGIGSPVYGSSSHSRVQSLDYGLQRLFASQPVSSASNFSLRRLFSD